MKALTRRLLALFTVLLGLVLARPAAANTLNAGDIVLTGFNFEIGTTSEGFSFMPLVNVPAGTVIVFSDRGWNDATATPPNTFGNFVSGGEGKLTWTVGAAGMVAGHHYQFSHTGVGAFSLTNATLGTTISATEYVVTNWTVANFYNSLGDNLFIYQDTEANPFFIFGINNVETSATVQANGWDSVCANTTFNTSTLPVAGVNCQNGISLGSPVNSGAAGAYGLGFPSGTGIQKDNQQYSGPITPTNRAGWLSRITNLANWTGAVSPTVPPNAIGFTLGASATIGNPPTVTSATTSVNANAASITIAGTNFDATAGNNSVTFSPAGTGTVTAATTTSLTVSVSGLRAGALNAVVTTLIGSSGSATQVATVKPVVTSSTSNLASNATSLTINGFGFDPTAGNNTVTFSPSGTGTVTAATATSLTVSSISGLTVGNLSAIVTSNSQASASTQVATVVSVAPTVTVTHTVVNANATTVTITGSNFDPIPGNNLVTFNPGTTTGTVTSGTTTSLTVTVSNLRSGFLSVIVTNGNGNSGITKIIADVKPFVTASTANLSSNATSLTITGAGYELFAGNNTVAFSPAGTGTVTAATATSLTVTGISGLTPGALNAVVTVNSQSSTSTQVATVVSPPPDYAITTASGTLTITDSSGNADTLAITEPSAGNILFSATGRTFSLNGAANTTNNSGNISLSGITSIVVNTAGGDDTITIGAFTASSYAFTINGGAGTNSVSAAGTFTISNFNFSGVGAGTVNLSATKTLDLTNVASVDVSSASLDTATVNLDSAGTINTKMTTTVATANAGANTSISSSIALPTLTIGSVSTALTINGSDAVGGFDYFNLQGLGSSMLGDFTLDGKGGNADVIEVTNATITVAGLNKNLTLRADMIGIGDLLNSVPTTPGVLNCSGNITIEATGTNSGSTADIDYILSSAALTPGVWGIRASFPQFGTGFMSPGDIIIRGRIQKSSGSDATLLLKATNAVNLDGTTLTLSDSLLHGAQVVSTSAKLDVTLQCDSELFGGGYCVIRSSTITTNGGKLVVGGGSDPLNTATNTTATLTGFPGVNMVSSTITTSGGDVSVRGRGNINPGVGFSCTSNVTNGGCLVDAGGGSITVSGIVGSGTNSGVRLLGPGSATVPLLAKLTTSGNITVTGVSANTLGNGVLLGRDTAIVSTGSGTITVTGTGAGTVTATNGYGILLSPAATTSSSIASAGGNVSLIADKMNLDGGAGTETVSTTGSGSMTLKPLTAAVAIDLGSAVDSTASTLELGVTELANVSANTLTIGDAASGTIKVSQVLAPTTFTTLALANNVTFAATGGFTSAVTSVSNFKKMTVAGTVNITSGADFTMTPNAFTWNGTDTFTLLDNDSTDAIVGTILTPTQTNFLGTSTTAQKSTTGGTGNDLVFGPAIVTPTVTSASPSVGGAGTNVTITGTGFTGATAVTIGGVAVTSFTFVDDTTITAIVPAGTTGAKDIVVSIGGTSGTGVGLFTYVDYVVTTTGGVFTCTDVSGNSDTLTVINQNPGSTIKFSAAGRTFSVNGAAPITGDSGAAGLSRIGATSITVNAGAGNDIINVGGFAGLPSLTINGGTGNDSVNFTGHILFSNNANLDVDLQNDDPNPGVDNITITANSTITYTGVSSATGSATLRASGSIRLDVVAGLDIGSGTITIEANQQPIPTNGDFAGVWIEGSVSALSGTIVVSGKGGNAVYNGGNWPNNGVRMVNGGIIFNASGPVTVTGVCRSGGDDGTGVYLDEGTITGYNAPVLVTGTATGTATGSRQRGVDLQGATGSSINGYGSATVTIVGTGSPTSTGSTTFNGNDGVYIETVSAVLSEDGNIDITGTGGQGTAATSGLDYQGIQVYGDVASAGLGSIALTGTAGITSTNNHGIVMSSVNHASGFAVVGTAVGSVTLTGSTTSAGGYGLTLDSSGGYVVDASANPNDITLIADKMQFLDTNTTGEPVLKSVGAGIVTLKPLTAGEAITLGGADSSTSLGLTSAELALVSSDKITVGSTDAGDITQTALITRTSSTNYTFLSNGNITGGGGTFSDGGGDVTMTPAVGSSFFPSALTTYDLLAPSSGTLALTSGRRLGIRVTSASVFDKLVVNGKVNITGAALQVTDASSGAYTPSAAQNFTIIDNQGPSAVTGTFAGLAEGATVSVNGVNKTITYTGGTGNDVVLQGVSVTPTVTSSTANINANATTLTITGTNFDTTAANNTVAFTPTGTGTVTAATATSLTVSVSGLRAGALNAVVTNGGGNSGTAVQVATVVPVITSSTANLLSTATTLTINGFGFDPTAANNTVAFLPAGTGTVTAATATTLTVTGITGLTVGALNAIATTNSQASTSTQVATVISAPTITTPTQVAINPILYQLGGNVTTTGGSAITERGIVFSITSANADPLIAGAGVTKVIQGGPTTGIFTAFTSTLAPNTAYSYKAYATNAAGTSYTTVDTFTTGATPAAGTFYNWMDATTVVGQANFTAQVASNSQSTTPSASACAISSTGKFAVTEQQGGGRVLIWNSIPTVNGTPADVVVGKPDFTNSTADLTQTLMGQCNGVAFSPDGSKLIVSDTSNHRVLIWNTVPTTNGAPADVVIGQANFTSGTPGVTATQLNAPGSVYVAPDGKLFVSDIFNNRILVYNAIPTTNGAAANLVIGQPNFTSNGSNTAANQLHFPWNTMLTPDGKLLVADFGNHRVLIYNSVPTTNGAAADVVIGQPSFGVGISGTTASTFANPAGVGLSPSGQLAIGEYGNSRVLIYNSIPTVNGAAADVVLGQPNFTTGTTFTGGISAHSMSTAYSTIFAADGRLLVSGRDMNRVMIFGTAQPAPTVTSSTANLLADATTLTITGTNFSTTAANNTVSFSPTGTGTVTAATATSLTVTVSGLRAGALNAVVTTNGQSSGAAVQVATVKPVITSSTANLLSNATTLTINGFGFDPTAANNTVAFTPAGTGTVTAATATTLTVTGITGLTNGALNAIVTSNSQASATAQVATVVAPPPTVTLTTTSVNANATTLTITGTNFDTTAANNTVAFTPTGTGTVTAATATSLTVSVSGLRAGALNAVVTNGGGNSGSPVQVATVKPVITSSTANLLSTATTLTINGFGFDPTAGNNSVAFSPTGTGTVTASTATSLTVTSITGLTAGALNAVVTTNSQASASAQVATVLAVPSLSINDVSANEGNVGNSTFTFTVSLTSPALAGGVTFDIAAASNTASNGSDYLPASQNGVTIPQGSSSVTFDVTVKGDTTVEPNETFFVNVTNVVGATVTDGQGLGTILNDDAAPTVTLTTTSVNANAASLTITGTGFDTTAANNTVAFTPTGTGTVTAATATSLTVSVSGLRAGALNAVVTTGSGNSGSPVQVATVKPVITSSAANIANNATTLTINGFGFDPTVGNNTVTFTPAGTGTVTAATATSMTVSSIAGLTSGALNAVVTTNSQASASTQVATVVPQPTVSAINPALGTSSGGTQVTITGTDFLAGATVTIGGASATSVVVVNATTITCVTPPGTAGAPVSVFVTTSGGANTANTLYTYVTPGSYRVYNLNLNGPSESPPNASPGIGTGTVIIDTIAKTMAINVSFSGLQGNTTAAHIHSATAVPFTATAGVATTTPNFVGFPLGVTAGAFTATYDMTLASSYNPAFISANGTTPASAFTAFIAGCDSGKAYFNIHTSSFASGEIRSFLIAAPPAPEINVKGNGVTIADGDSTPSTTDHTDFGNSTLGGAPVVRTFTVENLGSLNLNLTGAPNKVVVGGANAADFSVTTVPTSPITPAGSTTFQVTFTPGGSGLRSATLSIDNNDGDENPHNFSIQGTGVCQTITVTNPATTTGNLNVPFSQTFTQTGGIGATAFTTASVLPAGLALSSAGVLSGTPMQTGTFPITVTATDSNLCTGTSSTYTLVIYAPPTVTAAFGAATMPAGGTSTLTYTITNPNVALALTGVALYDVLPPGLTIATPNGLTSTAGGTLVANAGTDIINLTGGTLAAGGTATITLNITSTVLGVKTGMYSTVTSTEAPLVSNPSQQIPVPLHPVFGISTRSFARQIITGSMTAADPTQTGRMGRNGVASQIGTQKAYPGDNTTSGARHYDSYSIPNTTGVAQDVQVWISGAGTVSTFGAAYLGSFNPVSLSTNYLADAGASFPGVGTYGFTIPAGQTAVLIVHEVDPDIGGDYVIGVNTPIPVTPSLVTSLPSINVVCPTIAVTNPATASGTQGLFFSQTFTQSGGVGATTFGTASTLPTGLTLSTAGVLSGTPTQFGTFPIVVRATDSNLCTGDGATYNLVIGLPAPVPVPSSSGGDISSGNPAGDASGVAGIGTWDTLRTGAVLAANGDLAFRANLLVGTGTPPVTNLDFQGIWEDNGTTTALKSRAGAIAPGTGSGVWDQLPINPWLASNGRMTFGGLLRTGTGTPAVTSNTDGGLWSELGNGTLKLLLREGQSIPGIATFVVDLLPQTTVASSTVGNSAFTIRMRNGAARTTALVRADVDGGGVVTLTSVATQGGAAPAIGGGNLGTFYVLNGNFTDPRMNDAGNIAFAATLNVGGGVTGVNDTQGIWFQTNAASALAAVARAGATAPGTSGAKFTAFERPTIADGGAVAFRGFIDTGGDNGANNKSQGIWASPNGTAASLVPVIRTGDTGISGMPVGSTVASVWSPFSSKTGKIAFRASIIDGGIEKRAIFSDNGGTMKMLYMVGSAVPNLAGETFDNIDHPVIGDNGHLAFVASTNAGKFGVWKEIVAGSGTANLLMKVGDSVTTSAGPKTVASISIPGTGTSDRSYEQEIIDAAGEMLVFVTYLDGSQGILLSP